MASEKNSLSRVYKICALLGTFIILADIVLSLTRIQSFEGSVADIFESMVMTQLELDGLKTELEHFEKVLIQIESPKKDQSLVGDIKYSAYEIERIKAEQGVIQLFIQEKQLDLVEDKKAKKNIMNEVRILFFSSLIFLVLGTLLAVFGYLAWYFKIELFEERRKQPR